MNCETCTTGAAAPRIELLPPMARFSLRARPAQLEALGLALGAVLPRRIGRCARDAHREVVCLGPDEWLICASEKEKDALRQAFAAAYANAPHALADISDRELSYRVSGPSTLDLMAIGCPRDLRRLPEGAAVRTVFDGASVILWRLGREDFRIDVWRSFAPHLCDLLETGSREIAAGL